MTQRMSLSKPQVDQKEEKKISYLKPKVKTPEQIIEEEKVEHSSSLSEDDVDSKKGRNSVFE